VLAGPPRHDYGMTTAIIAIPGRRRSAWRALRAAQILLALPLGALQLAAVAAWTATGTAPTSAGYAIAAAEASLAATAIAIAFLLPRRTFLVRRTAFALLRCATVLGLLELIAYHRWGSLLFLLCTAAAWPLLALDQRRHPSFI
jgi:hypothetical protein